MTGRIDNSQSSFRPFRSLGTRPLDAIDLPDTPKMAGDVSQVSSRGTQPLQAAQTETLKAPTASETKSETPWWKKVLGKAEAAIDSAKSAASKGVEALETGTKELQSTIAQGEAKAEAAFETAKETADHILDTTKEVAKAGVEVVEAGVSAAKQDLSTGKGIKQALHDGINAAESDLAKKADPMLDKTLGTQDFKDAGASALNPINADVVSRLGVGESVSLRLDAGCTFPLEEFGIPNALLDGAGTITLKRVQKNDDQGKPILKDGQPVTELQATLELSGKAGAAYTAAVGVKATVVAGSKEMGVRAVAGDQAGASLTGKAAFTFSYDPDSTQEMGKLDHLLTGSIHPKELAQNITQLDGEGGLYAEATAYAGANVGIFGKQEPEEGQASPKHLTTYNADDVYDGVLGTLNVSLAQADASLGLGASCGEKLDVKTGERTRYYKLNGTAEASAGASSLGMDKSSNFNGTISVTLDKAGQLKGITLDRELSVEEFKGIETTIESASGRPISPGLLAQLGDNDTIKVAYALSPDTVNQMNGKNLLQNIETLIQAKKTKISVTDIHQDSAELGFDFDSVFGGEVGIRAKISATHGQDTAMLS